MARIGRRGDAEQVGAEEVNAHDAPVRGAAHHLGGVADVHGIADVAFREGDVDVLEALGGGANCIEVGLCGLCGSARHGDRREKDPRTPCISHHDCLAVLG